MMQRGYRTKKFGLPDLKPLDFHPFLCYTTYMRKNQPVTTPESVVEKLKPFVGKTFLEISESTGVPFPTSGDSKGVVGWFIESLVGLSRDNDRLDYPWGDLKAKVTHKDRKPGNIVVGSLNSLVDILLDDSIPFAEVILGRKISQTVLVMVNSNRKGGGGLNATSGWENYTFDSVSNHLLRDMPEWQGVCEDWSSLRSYVWDCILSNKFVSSGRKGTNNFLCFNSCGGKFMLRERNLRKNGGLQLALGSNLVQKLCQE